MTLAELKQYVADKRKRQASEWANQIAIHGQCTGFFCQLRIVLVLLVSLKFNKVFV